MGTLAIELWPHIVTAIIAVISMYFGAVRSMMVRVAVLEQKVESLQKRVTDDILNTLGELKNEVSKQLGQIAVDIAKINTTLNIVGKT